MKKKILSIILVLTLALSLFAACSMGNDTEGDKNNDSSTESKEDGGKESAPLKIFAMKGPTGMGMAKLISDTKAGVDGHNFEFTIAENVNEKLSDLIAGNFDIAAVPTNFAASVLYNKAPGVYSIYAVNTLGVLYILDTNDSVKTVNDLRGKTLYATGEGTVPQFVLEYVLKKAGLVIGQDINVEYLSTAAEVGALLEGGIAKVAMLPQPYVTTLLNKSDKLKIALDLTAEWDKLSGGESRLMTGCIVVKNELLKNDPTAFHVFSKLYDSSVKFINTASDEAAQAVVDAGIVGAVGVAKKAIPKCNITLITGEEMRSDLKGFFTALHSINPKSVGGKVPADDIFFE